MRGRRRRKVNTRHMRSPQVHKAHRYAPQTNTTRVSVPAMCLAKVQWALCSPCSPSKPPDHLSLSHVGHKCSRYVHSCEHPLKLTFLQVHCFPPALLDLLAKATPVCHKGNFFSFSILPAFSGGRKAGRQLSHQSHSRNRVCRAPPMEASHSST